MLSNTPFPNEPFGWTGIDPRHVHVVTEVLAALDDGLGPAGPPVEELGLNALTLAGLRRHVQARIDDEYRTITRRLLARVARAEPGQLSRSSAVETAAAFAWLALTGNDAFRRQGRLRATDIWYLFGVESCTRRGRALYRSLGFASSPDDDTPRGALPLPDPELMHFVSRGDLLRLCEHFVAEFANGRRQERESQPIQALPDGRIRIAAKPMAPRWAIRFKDDGGRSQVIVTFGEREDKPEVRALSVPDARHLISMLEKALAVPFRRDE